MTDPYKGRLYDEGPKGVLPSIVAFCLENRLLVFILVALAVMGGVMVAPFDWQFEQLPRRPVAVDAIPDIGENQQIVFTAWPGRSPQDVQDQITFPLTTELMGIAGVRTVRSTSMFGFSSIFVIFDEGIGFNESRNLLLTRISSIQTGLPEGVQPTLGPEATALGQIFWYTLEGRDAAGNPIEGWDLQDLRTVQDWYLRYDLLASQDETGAKPIAEVASVGGYVKEYQIDIDPDAMRAFGVTLQQIAGAVRSSNRDVGARTIEINRVEYTVRGLGFIRNVEDVRNTVVGARGGVPITVGHVAQVQIGPAARRGVLDKDGAEAAGGVVVVRYGANPLTAIHAVKSRLDTLGRRIDHATDGTIWLLGAHTRELPDGRTAYVAVVPFYDRTGLIYETLGTLSTALSHQILVTIAVVVVLMFHLRSSGLIAGLLPLAVFGAFLAMKAFGVDANIVSLTGIAIAIGVMVDMGIVICENILRHLDEADPNEPRLAVIHRATCEVAGAVVTAAATTIIGFLPVFFMTGSEGKMFRPLAFTKVFALMSAAFVAAMVIPPAASLLLARKAPRAASRLMWAALLIAGGIALWVYGAWWAGAVVLALGVFRVVDHVVPGYHGYAKWVVNGMVVLLVGGLLTADWMPMGIGQGLLPNGLFVLVVVGGLLVFYHAVHWVYPWVLGWCLDHKLAFLAIPFAFVLLGLAIWHGPATVFGPAEDALSGRTLELAPLSWDAPGNIRHAPLADKIRWTLARNWDGMGREFMPPLDEGSYLWMPTTSPHASIGEVLDVMAKQDVAFASIPEVERAVGKAGRAQSPLDPAPVSMIETVILYKPEYMTGPDGRHLRFKYNRQRSEFERDGEGNLIPDRRGRPFRQWRDHIRTPDDIWQEIVHAGAVPGTTSAPKLQPIMARIVMLQTGMRAPMGLKVSGPSLEAIETASIALERALEGAPHVAFVQAERLVAKPYLLIDRREEETAATRRRYGITIESVNQAIEMAIGGMPVTTTVERRERYPVRVRYLRELRDSIEEIGRILVAAPGGAQLPLEQVASLRIEPGPEMIRTEDTFLVNYVIFDSYGDIAEVDVVERLQAYLAGERAAGRLHIPEGVTYEFVGNYLQQIRATRTLMVVLPITLTIIFVLLYLKFRRVSTTLMVFSGIAVAWSGGFLLLWLYGQPWFLNVEMFGAPMRDVFQVRTVYLSVAVWVGFLSLFGIATDDGVVMATYLDQSFEKHSPGTREEIKQAVIAAGTRRIRACLMTTATTVIALLPVLTARGRGADIMVPMAIPVFGGMLLEVLTMLVVPVLYMMGKQWPHYRARLLGFVSS